MLPESNLFSRFIVSETARCLLCHDPVCTKVCPKGYNPGRVIRALRFRNNAEAHLIASGTICCGDEKTVPPCEQACIRGHLYDPIRIRTIMRAVGSTEEPQTKPLPDLSIDFCGIPCENPFLLASSPVANRFDMCVRALEAGWGGLVYKTISIYKCNEVSPRFDTLGKENTPFIGFRNLEQLSEKTPEENFDVIRRLKERFPKKVIVASIMGENEEQWTQLARQAQKAKADIVECNFSCPQMTAKGLGADIGASEELVRLYTQAVRRGTTLPVLAKMTPNTGNMTQIAQAAIEAGATGIAAINTVKCLTHVDPESFVPTPDIMGYSAVSGYSGKAIKPIALRFVRDIASAPGTANVPLSGIGGIETWEDAMEFILLGCTNVQVATSVMQYGNRIIDDLTSGLRHYMATHRIERLEQLVGRALPHVVAPEKLDRTTILFPKLEKELCIGCGRCYLACRDGGHDAIEWNKRRKPEMLPEKCVGCHLCRLVCPSGAIGERGSRTPKTHLGSWGK